MYHVIIQPEVKHDVIPYLSVINKVVNGRPTQPSKIGDVVFAIHVIIDIIIIIIMYPQYSIPEDMKY